jgi:hypothetical protein
MHYGVAIGVGGTASVSSSSLYAFPYSTSGKNVKYIYGTHISISVIGTNLAAMAGNVSS